MAELDTWLPIGEVMQRLGMSERGVYRRVSEGKLRQAQRPVPGRKPLPVYNPDDVDTLAAQSIRGAQALGYGAPPIMPPLAESLAEKLGAIAEAIAGGSQQRLLSGDPDNSGDWRNVASWPVPTHLTIEQAVRYTGLGEYRLRAAVKWEKAGPRGALVCRRADLEML